MDELPRTRDLNKLEMDKATKNNCEYIHAGDSVSICHLLAACNVQGSFSWHAHVLSRQGCVHMWHHDMRLKSFTAQIKYLPSPPHLAPPESLELQRFGLRVDVGIEFPVSKPSTF
eukprot:5192161-Amphidinium_carterae.1